MRDRTSQKIGMIHRRTALHWIIFLCFLGTCSLLSAQVGPWLPAETPEGGGTIPNPAPTNNATFGNAISISADRLAVGAFGDSEVYIFERDPLTGQWQPGNTTGSIAGQLPPLAGWFGWSVSIFEDVLAVGAPEDWPGGASFSGSTHIFERDTSTGQWDLTQSIPNPDLGNYEEFGKSVSLWEDRLAIGTAGDNPGPVTIYGGSVSIFERDRTTEQWLEVQLLPHPDPQGEDIFGETVALCGNLLAVGAPWQPIGSITNAGSVYLYERDVSTGIWALVTTIPNPQPEAWEEFGRELSLDGDLLVVGVPLDNSAGTISGGSVYLYQRDTTTGQWLPAQAGASAGNLPGQLIGPNPTDEEGFGSSVSLHGDLLTIGANADEVAGFADAGSVYIYQRAVAMGPWQLLQTIPNPDPQQFDRYGDSVAITVDVLAVAAAFEDMGAVIDAGTLHLYEPQGVFIRGDCNVDGSFNIADAIKLLSYLFSGGVLPSCLDSCDGNDDGNLDLADAITMLNELFLPGSPPLPVPDSVCSIDPTDDPLNCGEYNCP